MKLFLLACAGGAIGAGGRHLVNIITVRSFGLDAPWATFAVNVVGSLLMGIVIGYIVHRMPDAVGLRIFVATGILGGFTTFSAFSLDTFALLSRGDVGPAAAYVIGSVVLSVAAAVAGYTTLRALLL